jgi:hypothetical protein
MDLFLEIDAVKRELSLVLKQLSDYRARLPSCLGQCREAGARVRNLRSQLEFLELGVARQFAGEHASPFERTPKPKPKPQRHPKQRQFRVWPKPSYSEEWRFRVIIKEGVRRPKVDPIFGEAALAPLARVHVRFQPIPLAHSVINNARRRYIWGDEEALQYT